MCHRRALVPLALALLAWGCGGQAAGPCPAVPPSGDATAGAVFAMRDLPAWTLGPGLPLGSRDDLTGVWISHPSRWLPLAARRVNPSGIDPLAPGPIERAVGCQNHFGVEAVMLRQDGTRVVARWVIEAAASGAERRWSTDLFEIGEGNVAEGVVELAAVRMARTTSNETGWMDATFSPVTYELRFEESTGHLVGTRDGEPFRLVPLRLIEADPGECPGPPP